MHTHSTQCMYRHRVIAEQLRAGSSHPSNTRKHAEKQFQLLGSPVRSRQVSKSTFTEN